VHSAKTTGRKDNGVSLDRSSFRVSDRLATDLQAEFPDMSGPTSRNLLSMKIFSRESPEGPIAKQPVSQLAWGQIIRLMQMVKDPTSRDFYIRETLAHGWSRDILEIQIRNQLHLRAGKAQNNFALTVDDLLRHPADQPTIGLLLCRKKNKLVAEYALRGLDQPIAVAAWQTRLTESLPEDLRGSLPTIEEIEAELANEIPPVKPGRGGKS